MYSFLRCVFVFKGGLLCFHWGRGYRELSYAVCEMPLLTRNFVWVGRTTRMEIENEVAGELVLS